MNHQITTLPNGIRVITEHVPGAKSVSMSLGVGVGSRHETEDEQGISHLIEHMSFKSTQNRDTYKLDVDIDNIHGEPNAETSKETTLYYLHVVPKRMEKGMELLADLTLHSKLNPEELKRESKVVVEEIREYKDDPSSCCDMKCTAKSFAKHPLGRSVLGTIKSVSGFTVDDLKAFKEKHYVPSNMVFAVSGNIGRDGHEKIVQMAEKYFDIPASEKVAPRVQPAKYTGGDVRVYDELAQTQVMISLPVYKKNDRTDVLAKLYSLVLDGGPSSRLYREVRHKKGMVYGLEASVPLMSDMGTLDVSASCVPRRAGTLARVLCKQIASMAENITDEELERAKEQVESATQKGALDVEDNAKEMCDEVLMTGKYVPLKEHMKKLRSVTREELMEFARDICKGKMTFSALGNHDFIPPLKELENIVMPSAMRHAVRDGVERGVR